MNRVWLFLIVGVAIVLLADNIAFYLVPKDFYSATSYGWNSDKQRYIAMLLRWLGAMSFATGLVERIVFVIRTNAVKT